jgi:hypothetical protein
MERHSFPAVALAALGLALATPAASVPITPAAFSGSQSVESFEGIGVGPNVGASVFGNIVLPAISSNLSFASGVTLTSPVPNPGLFANGAFVHDLSLGGAVNNWGSNGNVDDAGDVPDPFGAPSSSYLGIFDSVGAGSVSLELSFGSDMLRVGAWVAGVGGSTIRLDAYDASGTLLESVVIAAPSVASWGNAGSFLGLERAEGIRRVVFTGVDFGIDGLSSEPVPPVVPEPATLPLVSAGLVLLALRSRRARR